MTPENLEMILQYALEVDALCEGLPLMRRELVQEVLNDMVELCEPSTKIIWRGADCEGEIVTDVVLPMWGGGN